MATRLRIAALLNLEMSDELESDLDLGAGLTATNRRDRVKKLISENMIQMAGHLEVLALLDAPLVVYELSGAPAVGHQREVEGLNRFLYRVQRVLLGMWLMRDNAVDTELAFAEVPYRGPNATVTSNFIGGSTSTSRGGRDLVSFSRDDLLSVRRMLDVRIGDAGYLEDPTDPPDLGRMGRFLYLLQGARGHHDLGLKTGFYMTALEALFSTSSSELSHKLSERVAYFLASAAGERKDLYQHLKRAYTLRSTVFHGDHPSKKQRKSLIDSSRFCDDVCRRVLLRFMREGDLYELFSTTASLEEYMLDLTLGVTGES